MTFLAPSTATRAIKWWLALLSLWLSFSASSHAESSKELSNLQPDWEVGALDFRSVRLFEKLTAGRIQAIQQSPDGLMWIGTRLGLFLYNGRQVRGYFHDPRDPTSIPDDSIQKLHFDAHGHLWVGTQRGLARFDPDSETFIRYLDSSKSADPSLTNQVNGIVHSAAGELYATNEEGEIFRYDEIEDRLSRINANGLGPIKSLAIDPSQRLWVGTAGSVYRLDPVTLETQQYSEGFESGDGVSINYVTSICFIDEEEIWIGTSSKGLLILNSKSGKVQGVPSPSQPESYVNKVYLDESDRVWTANNAGLSIYDRKTKTPLLSATQHALATNMPPSGINALFVDHQGSIWAGSNYDGVSKTTSFKKFRTEPLHELNADVSPGAPASAFEEDRFGNLWVGYAKSGVAMYPKSGSEVLRIVHDPRDPSSITDQPILCIHEDSKGIIWLGTYRGGLFSYDPQTKILNSYLHDPNDPDTIGGHDIRDIAEDKQGNLWLATHGNGIAKRDAKTGKFSNYTVENRGETGFYVPNNWINSILIDSNQQIWLSCTNGVTCTSADRSQHAHYAASTEAGGLSNSRASDVFEDSMGRIWVTTKDGLNLFHPGSETFTSYSLADGFPHRAMSSIIEDLEGDLWIGTQGGLARFDPETCKADAFNTSDGLVSDDFFEVSVMRAKDGTLYFGQNKGLTRFDPREIHRDTTPPDILITGIQIFGRELHVSSDGPLPKSILRTSKIKLEHDQDDIAFEFVAIDYKNPARNLYRYKLEGFDEDWSPPSSQAEAVYTNLPSGEFNFRVQGSNIDGFWNEAGDSLIVQITPPYWGTVSFRVQFAVLALSIPLFLYLWRVSSIKSEARRLEKAVEERTKDLSEANRLLEEANERTQSHGELLERTVRERTKELEIARQKAERSDKLKSAFLANMSHEIRTPMNAIIGFLHILENKNLSDTERQQFHGIIQQSSKSLMSLIDDILDLSAIEAGEAEISPQLCDIDEICKELSALFRETLSLQKGSQVMFELQRIVPDSLAAGGSVCMMIDPLRLKQILWNLLSNALKFTDSGEIQLILEVEEEQEQGGRIIRFSVKDTGIGIPREEHQRIFNRFHKLDEIGKKLYRGTGLGLAITHTLVELMEGKIALESEPNVGTTFFVTFPFHKESAVAFPGSKTESAAPKLLDANFQDIRLLVAEDEPPNFEYIKRTLMNTGITIEWAITGLEALKLFESRPFDLALLDLKLPEMDGLELARRIRQADPDLPIVIQSAYAMREDYQKSTNAGANEHLAKPFSPDQLIGVLAKYINKPEMNRPNRDA